MNDPYYLQRFITAQQPIYPQVVTELRAGRKRSHWMWFIFPQLQGLGHSNLARLYAISSLDEAQAYTRHPVLGARLRDCSRLVAAIEGRSMADIFGHPDDMKFHSSMTLFAETGEDHQIFLVCLQKYFDGKRDPFTLAQLGRQTAT